MGHTRASSRQNSPSPAVAQRRSRTAVSRAADQHAARVKLGEVMREAISSPGRTSATGWVADTIIDIVKFQIQISIFGLEIAEVICRIRLDGISHEQTCAFEGGGAGSVLRQKNPRTAARNSRPGHCGKGL